MRFGYGCLCTLFLLVCSTFSAVAQSGITPSEPMTEEVRFQNAGTTLVGTLFKPERPVAAVVLVHGSGREKRMTRFASRLAADGIAVLTYDKRGVGESGGIYAGPEVGTNNIDADNLRLLSADTRAAVGAMTAHLPTYRGPVGLLGFSQAGWVIPLAAASNPAVTFMVLFSGPVASTHEQFRFQSYTEGKSNFWDTHTDADARMHIRDDPDRYQFADTDPRDALAGLSIRGLWLFGGKDVQAPVPLSIERLQALASGGKRYEYRLFPTLGHNLSSATTKEPTDVAVGWIKSLSDASM